MSNHLIEKLEMKIEGIIKTMEALRNQIEALEAKNHALHHENANLKARQSQWEQGLVTLIDKLDEVPSMSNARDLNHRERAEVEEMDTVV